MTSVASTDFIYSLDFDRPTDFLRPRILNMTFNWFWEQWNFWSLILTQYCARINCTLPDFSSWIPISRQPAEIGQWVRQKYVGLTLLCWRWWLGYLWHEYLGPFSIDLSIKTYMMIWIGMSMKPNRVGYNVFPVQYYKRKFCNFDLPILKTVDVTGSANFCLRSAKGHSPLNIFFCREILELKKESEQSSNFLQEQVWWIWIRSTNNL